MSPFVPFFLLLHLGDTLFNPQGLVPGSSTYFSPPHFWSPRWPHVHTEQHHASAPVPAVPSPLRPHQLASLQPVPSHLPKLSSRVTSPKQPSLPPPASGSMSLPWVSRCLCHSPRGNGPAPGLTHPRHHLLIFTIEPPPQRLTQSDGSAKLVTILEPDTLQRQRDALMGGKGAHQKWLPGKQ